MSLFKWKKSRVPEWASFLNQEQYDAFRTAVTDHVRGELKLEYEMTDGVIRLAENQWGIDEVGLDNLARICRGEPLSEYPEIIREHFDSVVAAFEQEKEFNQKAHDLEFVRPYLALRLYPADYLAAIPAEQVLSGPFAGDLFRVLVFDLPEHVLNVTPNLAKDWKTDLEELMAIGAANVRARYPVQVEEIPMGPGRDVVRLCTGDHFFVSNVLLDLDSREGFIGKYGSLVAAPNRGMVGVYPINDLRVLEVVQHLLGVIREIYEDEPGPLSNQLFWYHQGKYLVLPHEYKKDKLQFYPPEAFVQVLNRITADSLH